MSPQSDGYFGQLSLGKKAGSTQKDEVQSMGMRSCVCTVSLKTTKHSPTYGFVQVIHHHCS